MNVTVVISKNQMMHKWIFRNRINLYMLYH